MIAKMRNGKGVIYIGDENTKPTMTEIPVKVGVYKNPMQKDAGGLSFSQYYVPSAGLSSTGQLLMRLGELVNSPIEKEIAHTKKEEFEYI
jgi:hypothetical protein